MFKKLHKTPETGAPLAAEALASGPRFCSSRGGLARPSDTMAARPPSVFKHDFGIEDGESKKGFGLVEIIIVTAIVSVALFGFSQAGITALKLLRNEKENLEAVLLAQESLEAVRSIRDESWTGGIAPLVNSTTYYPVVENSKWKLTTVSPGLINGKYDRYVIFDQVFRDGQDKISSSGSLDAGTRKIISRVTWNAGTKTKEIVAYITNFQEPLVGGESKVISFEDAPTDADLANFPSGVGNGDPAQSFTTIGIIDVTKVMLYLRKTVSSPSNIYVEIRTSPTGTILGTSNLINSTTLSSALSWADFRFVKPVSLSAATKYHIRLRSIPVSTDSGSGGMGTIHWGYRQTASSPYLGGEARRYIGRLANPSDAGQQLDQYDFGFQVYDLQ